MDAIFLTNQYRVLEVMYDNTISISDNIYCPLGQREVAQKLGLSRAIVNKMFIELKNKKYISMETRGKWKLSDKAIEIIKITRRL